MVVRPRRLGGVGARAVGGAGAHQPRAPDRPRARLGRGRRRAVGLERGRRRRGRAARPGGLVGRAGPAGAARASTDEPVLLLRREFVIDQPVVRARLYATAQGVYEAELNGAVVGDHVLAPGLDRATSTACATRPTTSPTCSPRARTPSASHLADGWYRGYVGFAGKKEVYGDRLGAFVQLEVEHPDGSRTVVTSDGSWRSTPRAGDPGRHLQRRDATTCAPRTAGLVERQRSTTRPGRRSSWAPSTSRTLVAPTGPPVRRTAGPARAGDHVPRRPGRRWSTSGRTWSAGCVCGCPTRPAGTEITLRHAEVLEHGELGHPPAAQGGADRRRRARRRTAPRTWEPRFTFHGFRYAEVTGWPGELTADDLEAVVVHTDLRRTGTFTCSDPDVNRLHENVVWGMRGNFVDVPTDCPQRDERLGWTGDLAVFAPTGVVPVRHRRHAAAPGWPTSPSSSCEDHDGVVPIFVPFLRHHAARLPAAAGGRRLGRRGRRRPVGAVRAHTATPGCSPTSGTVMTAWIDAFEGRAGADLDFPDGGFMFGDWLDTAAPPDQPCGRPDPVAVRRHRVSRAVGAHRRAGGRDARPRRHPVRRPRRPGRRAVPRRVRLPERPAGLSRRRRRTRSPWSSTCSPPSSASRPAGCSPSRS